MKAKVGISEILEAFKKEFGKETFSKEEAIKIIRLLYQKKTGEPCSKNTAMDKFKYLIDIGKIKPSSGGYFYQLVEG